MVPAPTRWPSPTSSPWIRRWPHPGFSRARRTTRSRTSSLIQGRPGRFGYVQCRATRRRCQDISVPGVTIRCLHSSRGRARTNADSTARSGHDSLGLPTWRRSTATSCRSTNNSATIADSPPTTRGNQPNTPTAVKYSSRTTMHPILRDNHKTPAHALCEQFWHGTGSRGIGPVAGWSRRRRSRETPGWCSPDRLAR